MKLKCSKCLEHKNTNAFSIDKTKKRGYQYICKDCHNEYTRKVWYIKNREKQKINARNWKLNNENKVLATRYKTTTDHINKLVASMTGLCPVCSRPMTRRHLDHDHKTGTVRNFICSRCNMTLGLVEENISILKQMILYIEKHASVV